MSSSKIQRYGVDNYVLKINPGGTIEIDPGPTGAVTIDGDLTVLGNTTTIESIELVIVDNTITLNSGEDGNGVTLGSAGILIDRGNLANVGLFFDENKSFTNPGINPIQVVNGAFILAVADGDGNPTNSTVGLYTNTINTTNGNDLLLLTDSVSTGTLGPRLSVFNTVSPYEKRVFLYTGDLLAIDPSSPDRISQRDPRFPTSLSITRNKDVVPNIRAVTDYVQAHYERNFQSRLISPGPDGKDSLGDLLVTGFSEIELSSTTDDPDSVNKIDFKVNNSVPVASYFQSEIRLFDVKVNNSTLSTTITDGDVKLSGNGTGSVKIISPLNLEKITDPAQPINGTTVYAKDEADGGTGIFFINEVGTQDELISRNKALLFSIIF